MNARLNLPDFFTNTLLLLLLCCLTTSPLPAEDYKLADWTFGEIIAGDEMDLDALNGRVVAIEYWGPR